jgi:hypothetical protein
VRSLDRGAVRAEGGTVRRSSLAGSAVLAVSLVMASSLPSAAAPNNNNSQKLRAAVDASGIMEHAQALQAIAEAHGGNRLAGAPGYESSAEYVAARARAAGYDVELQEFEYDLDFIADWQAPVLDVVGGPSFVPGIAGATSGGDFGSMYKTTPYSVDVTAPVWVADVVLPAGATPNSSTSGCEDADYAGMPEGAIVLVQRGTCSFADKFLRADASGAAGMVFINEGQPGRTEPLWFSFDGIDIPTVAATVETGAALAEGAPLMGAARQGLTGESVRFRIDWRPGTYTSHNVIAESRTGDPDNVVVVGAHLDSVGVGPGINDNGSGSAGILEIAEEMAKVTPRNQVRFIWFSAEESGLLGAEAYVASLTAAEREQIAAMLNFDMIGSPNFVRFVYDGDLSDSPPPPSGAPEGSAAIERLFLDYFASQGLPTEPTEFSGRSDYGPFLDAGIPAGGLFTGAEGIKTPDQAVVFGGTAGEQYDPCYHLGCDDLSNVSLLALEQMADAAAHATISLAQSTEIVNGVRGKGNFSPRHGAGHEHAAPLATTSGS